MSAIYGFCCGTPLPHPLLSCVVSTLNYAVVLYSHLVLTACVSVLLGSPISVSRVSRYQDVICCTLAFPRVHLNAL